MDFQSNYDVESKLESLLDNINLAVMTSDDKQAVNMGVFKSELRQLKTAMLDNNLNEINDGSKKMQKYLLDAIVGDTINEILQNKMLEDYEEAIRLIDTILEV